MLNLSWLAHFYNIFIIYNIIIFHYSIDTFGIDLYPLFLNSHAERFKN